MTAGPRRLATVIKYNPDHGKGRIEYLESTDTKCELPFYQDVIQQGTPAAGSKVSFTLSNGKVTGLWVSKSSLKTESSEDTCHVLTVYHPNILDNEDVILTHALKLEEAKAKDPNGYIYWGKIVEDTGESTSGIDAQWVQSINEEIDRKEKIGRKVKLIVTDFQNVFIAPLRRVHLNSPLTSNFEKYEKMPEYYTRLRMQNRPCEVFFEITDLFKVERDMLLSKLFYLDPVSQKMRLFSPFESNITYPKIVSDPEYAFDDGNDFNPEYISNAKKAHFYDILSGNREHDEEVISTINLNLIEEALWNKLPALARTHLIEAEIAYKRISDRYKNRELSIVDGAKVCMSYLNAVEAILKDSKDSPYVAFRKDFLAKNPHKKDTHIDFTLSLFCNQLTSSGTSKYKSIQSLGSDIYHLAPYVEALTKMRNHEAHPTSAPGYTFQSLKAMRNSFWGINSLKMITDDQTTSGMINILIKLYSLNDQRNRFKKTA